MAKDVNCKLEIMGKNLLPEIGELKAEIIIAAIARFVNKKLNIEKTLKLGKEEIGVYANRFREYVISLLEKSDMYLAEMEYGDSVLQPGKYISGNLYQEQQT